VSRNENPLLDRTRGTVRLSKNPGKAEDQNVLPRTQSGERV